MKRILTIIIILLCITGCTVFKRGLEEYDIDFLRKIETKYSLTREETIYDNYIQYTFKDKYGKDVFIATVYNNDIDAALAFLEQEYTLELANKSTSDFDSSISKDYDYYIISDILKKDYYGIRNKSTVITLNCDTETKSILSDLNFDKIKEVADKLRKVNDNSIEMDEVKQIINSEITTGEMFEQIPLGVKYYFVCKNYSSLIVVVNKMINERAAELTFEQQRNSLINSSKEERNVYIVEDKLNFITTTDEDITLTALLIDNLEIVVQYGNDDTEMVQSARNIIYNLQKLNQ